jgi:hypothetical protein
MNTKFFNPLNAKLNPICHLLALLGAHHILHVSRIRFNELPEYIAEFVLDKKHFISTLKSLIDKSLYSHEEIH